jgi:hypothetical protein
MHQIRPQGAKARNPPASSLVDVPSGVRNAHTIGGKFKKNAKELADKFNAKTGAAAVERQRQSGLAAEHVQKREIHCKRAMERNVLPFLAELKQHLGRWSIHLCATDRHTGSQPGRCLIQDW